MNVTTLEKTNELPVIESTCNHTAPAPTGRASVLQDKLLVLLKEADDLMNYPTTSGKSGLIHKFPNDIARCADEKRNYISKKKLGDKSRYITLTAEDSDHCITGEIWTKAGEYIRLATVVDCKVEQPFRMAVDFEALYLLTKLLSERVDFIAHTDTNKLELRCGSCVSRFIGLPLIELEEPIDSKPVVTYTKEQQNEFKWLGKAAAKESNRPVLRFAYAETVNDTTYVATADGYRAHYTTSQHIQGLNGLIDINHTGNDMDHRFPNVGAVAAQVTGQKVNVYYGDLLKAVKAVMKMKPDAGEITFSFHNHVLMITGYNSECGEASAHLLCSTVIDGHFSVKGQYVLDCLAGCDGIPNKHDANKQHTVMFQFNEPNQPIRIVPHVGRMAVIMPMSKER